MQNVLLEGKCGKARQQEQSAGCDHAVRKRHSGNILLYLVGWTDFTKVTGRSAVDKRPVWEKPLNRSGEVVKLRAVLRGL